MERIVASKRGPGAKAKQLRRAGIVPCVISGAALKDSLSIQLDPDTVRQLRRTKQAGSKVSVQVEGTVYHTLIKSLDYDLLNNTVVHISFHVLEAGKKVSSVADILLLNRDKVPGTLEQMQVKVPHAAEPEYLLDTVTVDLSGLPVGTTLTIGDIPAFQSDKIELLTDPGSVVLRIRDRNRGGGAPAERPAAAAE